MYGAGGRNSLVSYLHLIHRSFSSLKSRKIQNTFYSVDKQV